MWPPRTLSNLGRGDPRESGHAPTLQSPCGIQNLIDFIRTRPRRTTRARRCDHTAYMRRPPSSRPTLVARPDPSPSCASAPTDAPFMRARVARAVARRTRAAARASSPSGSRERLRQVDRRSLRVRQRVVHRVGRAHRRVAEALVRWRCRARWRSSSRATRVGRTRSVHAPRAGRAGHGRCPSGVAWATRRDAEDESRVPRLVLDGGKPARCIEPSGRTRCPTWDHAAETPPSWSSASPARRELPLDQVSRAARPGGRSRRSRTRYRSPRHLADRWPGPSRDRERHVTGTIATMLAGTSAI